MQELERRGKWYLPGRGRRKINGVLRFTPADGALLELDGLLDERTDYLFPSIILGETSQGEEITLYQCQQKGFRLGGKSSSSSFIADIVFVGSLFLSEEKLLFERVQVEFSHLHYWRGETGFKVNRKNSKEERGVTVDYTEQEPILLTTLGNTKISYTTIWRTQYPGTEANIKEQAFIRIDEVGGADFNQCSETVRIVQNFLSLIATEPVLLLSITALTKRGRTKRGKEVQIYYAPIYPNDAKVGRGNNMLFTLQEVQEQIGVHLRKWIENERTLEPVYNLFFANLYRPYIYAENRFLNLAQAVETYHRRTYGGKYQSDEEYLENLYQTFLSAIPSNIDKDFRTSLIKGKLRYANEFSLGTRLNRLIKLLKDYLPEDCLPKSEPRTLFVQDITNTRNFLTHYSPELEGKSADRPTLYLLEQSLSFILTACFLKDMDFSAEQVRKYLTRSKHYQRIRQLQRRNRKSPPSQDSPEGKD